MVNKQFRGIFPLKAQAKPVNVFGFDVETYHHNQKFLCASIVGKDGYNKVHLSRELLFKDIATNPLYRYGQIWATNAMFDMMAGFGSYKGVLEHFNFIDRNSRMLFSNGYMPKPIPDGNIYTHEGIIEADLAPFYKVTFCDTLNHYPASVEALGALLNFPKMNKPERLGRRPLNKAEWDYLIKYNVNDSAITYKFAEFLRDNYLKYNAKLKPTISATALDVFKRSFLQFPILQPKDNLINMCYKPYYGGRTEAFKRGEFTIGLNDYDINSMYPYVMKRFDYPNPYKAEYKNKITDKDLEYLGFGYFNLIAPDDLNIPILPVKLDKLYFPVGLIKGWYDFPTIKKALDLGYEITKFGHGIIFTDVFNPFREYITRLYKDKTELSKINSPLKIIPKLLMNSLYGKFGFKYMDVEELMKESDAWAKYHHPGIPLWDGYCRVCASDTDKRLRIPGYVNPILSAFVTAYARLRLYEFMRMMGFDNVYYIDTDSVFSTKRISTSDELGDMKLEGRYNPIIIIKPKSYFGNLDDRFTAKLKGVQRGAQGMSYQELREKTIHDAMIFQCNRYAKMRTAMNRGIIGNTPIKMTKNFNLEDTKRKWHNDNFTIKPQDSQPINLKKENYLKYRPFSD
jgi:hypothetical protein